MYVVGIRPPLSVQNWGLCSEGWFHKTPSNHIKKARTKKIETTGFSCLAVSQSSESAFELQHKIGDLNILTAVQLWKNKILPATQLWDIENAHFRNLPLGKRSQPTTATALQYETSGT